MKEFLIIRHAKSSWDHPQLADADRPLNHRGHRDAPFMAAFLRDEGIVPSHLISSPANRAYTTAEYFSAEFENELDGFWKETELYFGTEADWLEIIQSLDENIRFPAFFSHNPTLSYFVNRFTDDWIDNVPTCGVIHIRSSSDTWRDLYFDNAIVAGRYFPKEIRKSL